MNNKKPFAKNRMEYLQNLISPSKSDRILNIGVSNIPEIEMLMEDKVRECWTMDIDNKKLNNASRYLRRTRLIHADFSKYDKFGKGYFDKIIMLEVLEHLDNDVSALKKLNFLLRKGGALIIAVPNNSFLHILNPVKYTEHKRHYSNEQIKSLLSKAGFRITHFNVVECWTLLANLWIHIFSKFILRRSSKFGVFSKKADATYGQYNKSGLDIIVKSIKV